MKWTSKYRPKKLDDVHGNTDSINALTQWAHQWDDSQKPVILHGPPGVGKTTASHALAHEMGWETIEMNASEQRTKDVVEKVAGGAANMGTLSQGANGKRLVILDEADSLHGNADRGGSGAMTSVVKDAKQPTILIVNEYYEMSNTVRNYCEDIEFTPVSNSSIEQLLKEICETENIEYDRSGIKKIINNANGDVRAAVSDLQAVAGHTGKLTAANVTTATRDRKENMFSFLDKTLKEESPETVHNTAQYVDETPDDIFQWVEDNVTKEYSPRELYDAYNALGKADVWLGRVYSGDHNYKYWKYVTDQVTAGVASSRSGSHTDWTRWGPPSYWQKLGSTHSKRDTRDKIAESIAKETFVSIETTRDELLPYLKHITHHCKPKHPTIQMAAIFDLNEGDVSFITGSGESTNKVENIVSEADDLRKEQIQTTNPSHTTDTEPTTETSMNSTQSEQTPESNDTNDESTTEQTTLF